MGHSFYHALSNTQKWGGKVEDYLPLHQFLDSSRNCFADSRHRLALHHDAGADIMEKIYGKQEYMLNQVPRKALENSDKDLIPVHAIVEQHIREDYDSKMIYLIDIVRVMPEPPPKLKIFEPSLAVIAAQLGGKVTDYLCFKEVTDAFLVKAGGDHRGLQLLCNAFGVSVFEKLFGIMWQRPSDQNFVPSRVVAEKYIFSGWHNYMPTLQDVVTPIQPLRWMWSNNSNLHQQFAVSEINESSVALKG